MTLPPKKLLSVLSGMKTDTPPLWLMRQAGRYLPEYRKIRQQAGSFLDLCYSPTLATEVTLQPIERFGFDAAILFSDILVVPHALGMSLSFEEGEGPRLHPMTAEACRGLSVHKDKFSNKLSMVYEAVERIKSKLPKETTLIGFSGSPWTLAAYMIEGKTSRDFAVAKQFAYQHKEEFSLLINKLVESITLHVCNQLRAGAEVIQLFDSWAGLLTETEFEQWVIAPTAKIVSLVKEEFPQNKIIGFPRHSGLHYLNYAKKTGVDAVSIDQTLPLKWVKDHLNVIQGNLDPAILLTNKSTIEQEVNRILSAFDGKPFIFNLGHGILPSTPVEHVTHLVECVRKGKAA